MAQCVLFILSTRGYGYGDGYCGGCGSCANCNSRSGYNDGLPWLNNSGLFNSCAFVVDMLNAAGIGARLVQIDDPKDIAGSILGCGATDVIIEALFVQPAVLSALAEKFPLVRFVVRLHSEIPFLAFDGNAMRWLFAYLAIPSVSVAANTARARADLQIIVGSYYPHWDQTTLDHRVPVLPNYYPMPAPLPRVPSAFGTLNVGCLGAIRPLKSQLLQAVAALRLARNLGKRLFFHVNAGRVEGGAPSILTNLRVLMANAINADLIEHPWLARADFLDLCRRMDLGMQVSLSETFNIVAADFATNNIPLLVSPEIVWCDPRIQAIPTSVSNMVSKAEIALRAVSITEANRRGLLTYNATSQKAWKDVFGLTATGWTDRPASFVARPALTAAATHL